MNGSRDRLRWFLHGLFAASPALRPAPPPSWAGVSRRLWRRRPGFDRRRRRFDRFGRGARRHRGHRRDPCLRWRLRWRLRRRERRLRHRSCVIPSGVSSGPRLLLPLRHPRLRQHLPGPLLGLHGLCGRVPTRAVSGAGASLRGRELRSPRFQPTRQVAWGPRARPHMRQTAEGSWSDSDACTAGATPRGRGASLPLLPPRSPHRSELDDSRPPTPAREAEAGMHRRSVILEGPCGRGSVSPRS